PDGLAFAVLLGNLAVPLLDTFARRGAGARLDLDRNWLAVATLALGIIVVPLLGDSLAKSRLQHSERAALEAVMPASLHDNDLEAAAFMLAPATFANLDLLGLDSARTAYRARLNGAVSGIV